MISREKKVERCRELKTRQAWLLITKDAFQFRLSSGFEFITLSMPRMLSFLSQLH